MICVDTKSSYDVELLSNVTTSNENLECVGIKLSRQHIGVINCITVYRPPKGDAGACISTLNDFASKLKQINKHNNIIHGDFNINYANSTCKWARAIKGWETRLGLKQLINLPTRITSKSSSTIDLCFTDIVYVSLSGVIQSNLSDHLPTFILKKKSRETNIYKSFSGRCYKNLSAESVSKCLGAHVTHNPAPDPDEWWDQLESNYLRVADTLCPLRLFEIKKDRPAFLTDEISKTIAKRDRLFKKARLLKQDCTWKKAVKERKKVKILLKQAKQNFIKERIDNCKNNVNKYWRNMSSLLNRKKTLPIMEILSSEGKITKGSEAASEINNYFCNVGPNLALKVPPAKIHFDLSDLASLIGVPKSLKTRYY